MLLKVQCILVHLTQFLQDHSCSSFYFVLSRKIDPEYTGFVLCKRNMVSWLFQIVIIDWYWFYWCGCIIIFLLILYNQVQGQIQKIQKGLGKWGGEGRGSGHMPVIYLDTIYFIEHSLNIVHNFTEKGVAMVSSANPYLQCSLGVDVGRVACIFLEVVGPLLKF